MKAIFAVAAASLLVGASSAQEREYEPGEGVLCMAVFAYAADLQGDKCFAGKHPRYQARLDQYVIAFDAYLLRNFANGPADLTAFKNDQLGGAKLENISCPTRRNDNVYEAFRNADPEELDSHVADLLWRDGQPTFGDCV